MKLPSDLAEKQAPKKSRAHYILRTAGLLLGIFLIYWFASKSNLSGIWDQLKLINVRFSLLIAVTFIAYFLVTMAWKLSFYRFPGHISTALLFIIRQSGESLAQINPTNVIAGEALKAILLKRKNIPYKDSIVSLTISRFLVLFSAITLIMIGVYLFFDRLKFMAGTASLIAMIALMFALLVFLLYRLGSGKGILSMPMALLSLINRRFPHLTGLPGTIEKMKEADEELIDFYKTKKLNFIIAFMLSFTSWLMGASEFYVILYLLGLQASFLSCIAIEVGVMVFKGLGAFVPGQIGIEEYASKLMLEFVQVPGSGVWVTVSILRRARQLFWIGVGFIAFLIIIRNTGGSKDGNPVYNS
ncbi:MAG TPA: lysylphosphatidylglycerol synthase transmembrane domain-containing protein [Spirochaetota bacterium]|nr:lysylphosphatidylglycerol synthase transmembrane domain-containing protein [Spirochaetota bacterium]HQF07847.1 lysylphosphatidylglycerol synthase transmembrane domain-containing protein [Spirochaetota bacterium]HQH96900.1 lysylphosphatidylglycerol synthase transmembrane domain-containing protein [Spirochaetota bacterium]HQJ72745.1 lysylphosphatidylglycerol synthase transmembrane domain-containing protein [Spirochaetota bacterium]HRS79167.1 lysylphosphatidylglycerol synthase transmembrane dom